MYKNIGLAIGISGIILLVISVCMIDLKVDSLKSTLDGYEEKCSHILYIYPEDVHPEIFRNHDFDIIPFAKPEIKSKFCTYDGDKCIVDMIDDAYDDYCIGWVLEKRTESEDFMGIPFMNEYIEVMINIKSGRNTTEQYKNLLSHEREGIQYGQG